jgi:hypothetical protein
MTFPSVASAGASTIREVLRPVLLLAGATHVDAAEVGGGKRGGERDEAQGEHGEWLCVVLV